MTLLYAVLGLTFLLMHNIIHLTRRFVIITTKTENKPTLHLQNGRKNRLVRYTNYYTNVCCLDLFITYYLLELLVKIKE